jgi:hypothetical protein
MVYVDLHLEKSVKISGYVIHGAVVKIPWLGLATEYAIMFQGEGGTICPIGTAPSDKVIAEGA